ncbi:MAG: phosphatase PAP2 family protein [Mycobacterium sp.]
MRNRWLVLALMLIGYGLLWIGWASQWSWLHGVDTSLLATARRYGVPHHHWVHDWRVFSTVFGPWTFQVAAAVVALGALVRRRRREALFLLVGVVLTGTVTDILKDIAQRPRPVTALAHEPSWSFPSGHALGTLAGLLGLTAAALALAPARRRWVWIAAGIGAVMVLLIGVSRVVLNVHYPSDVLAGWLMAAAWFLATLPILTGRRTSDNTIVAKP